MTAQKLLLAALTAQQAGRYDDAAASCRKLLRRDPQHVDALHLLGLAARARGQLDEARQALEQVVRLRPQFAEALGNLGMVYAEAGLLNDSRVAYEQTLALKPGLAEVWFNLGNVCRAMGDLEGAAASYRAALARAPLAGAQQNLGLVLQALGDRAGSLAAFRAAQALAPGSPVLMHQLGAALQAAGVLEEAILWLSRAVHAQADWPEALNDLGNALNDFGRVAEAAACYQQALQLKPEMQEALNNLGNALRTLGQPREAEQCFRRALKVNPDFAEAWLNLGIVVKNASRADEALFCFRQALNKKPEMVHAYNNLGVVLTERGHHAEAIAALEQALQLDAGFAEAWNNLGNVYKNAGELEPAMEAFAKAVELRPDYAGAHSNFLFTLNFVDGLAPAQIAGAHRDWGLRHGNPAQIYAHERRPAERNRRLKIAYVSPDFRQHACAFFIEPLLREHHREVVEVYAYVEIAQPDAVTARLQSLVDVWRNTTGLPDEQVAAAIHADGIDVVIDLAGHSANNRLRALALKPAPVQLTYLGYPATTGLTAIDWRLTDAIAEPPGQSEQSYTERLYRLPHSLWCYQPLPDMATPGPPPALARGKLNFGSFNSYTKVGPRVVALWAAVLQSVPDSTITLITVPAGAAQEALWQRFEDLGVARERVQLHDRLPRGRYLALFDEVDIALDPFPCNGGTTTCDALWMGLPVVTLIGQSFLSRASLSVLTAAGYPQFAAKDEADYVARCVALAKDLPALAALRGELRTRLAASPLLDAPAFAADVEAAYRALWQDWCDGGVA